MDRRVSLVLRNQAPRNLTCKTDVFCSDPASPSARLLRHALAPASPQSQELCTHLQDSTSPNGGNTTIDFSLDSRIIPARPVTPRYHVHVASLETPENTCERALAKDFKKEKHREKGGEQVGTCHATSPVSLKNNVEPVELGSGSESFRQYGDNSVTASAGKVIGTKTASFQSPSTTTRAHPLSRPTKSMPVGNNQYHRSPSPPSQDSFGGPVSQDPVELYLASAKLFNVPLSDLGETPTQEVVHSPTDPGMALPDASEHKEFLEAAMRKYDAQRANRAASNHRSNILVAATPSNSDESLGTSQHKDDTFSFSNRGSEFTSRESRFEFNGSSSFDKMLERDLADAPDPTPDPTSPEVKPTQVEDDDAQPSTILTSPTRSSTHHSPPFEWVAPVPSAAVASSDPRSLLRMVHPYRIAKMRNLAGAAEPPSCATIGTETQPSLAEDSKLYHKDASTYSNDFPPWPRHIKVAGSRPTKYQRQENEDDDPEDVLDVVPDSEPLRAGPSTQTPTHGRASRQASPRKPFCACAPVPEDGSEELVLGSQEVEESEADIPLAVEAASRNVKRSEAQTEDMALHVRKTRTSTFPTKTLPALEEQHRKPTSSTRGKNSRAKLLNGEFMEVPTSLPEQDLHGQASEQLPSALINTLASQKQRRGPPNPEPSRTRHASAAKPIVGKKRFHTPDTESSAELSHHVTEDEGATHPEVQKEEEEESESVDDIDPSPPPPPKPDASRKKRRRIEDINLNRGTSKTSTLARIKRSETPGVATRSVRRLRSGVSSTPGVTVEAATRVFALWKQDGHYYSGVVHSHGSKNKYLVKFDDGTEDEVELKNMRHRILQAGDRVIATQDGIKGVVRDVAHADPQGWFILEIDNGEAVSTRRLDFCEICIANRTIQCQWQERMLVPGNIVTLVRPKPQLDTIPSRQSVVSSISGRALRELVKTGFVVTINPKNEEPIRTKDGAMRAIKRRGGLVVEDWSSVFTMEGKHSQSNKRWIATPRDFRWKSEVNLDRVFLLSDDAHQKPKFLLALALGIPCLSFEWLTREGQISSDWQPFLLPAGYSDTLGARITQLVDLDWGNCTEHLTDIMTSRVPIKLFSQKTVLCVGVDLVPLPSSRVKKNTPDEASRYVPWIILCMGAARVEAITDTKQVTPSHMQTFDYVIVKERDMLGSVKLGDHAVVGDVNWVKDCLVSSRLSPPEFD